MLRNKTTYFLPFCFFEMDENTKKDNMDHGRKGQKNRKTRRNIGKVPKKCVKVTNWYICSING